MTNRRLAIIAAILLFAAAVAVFYFSSLSSETPGPVLTATPTASPSDSLPSPNGQPVIAPGSNQLILLETPQEGDSIGSPLTIMGQARGNWFFEATFPVVLTDWDGRIIAEGYATT